MAELMTLRPRPRGQLALLGGFVMFGAMGAFLLSRDEPYGWVCAAFAAICLVVGVLNLLPGSSYLRLTPTGMELSSLYRKWFIRWDDVQKFFPARVATRAMVCWQYAPAFSGQQFGRKWSLRLTGVEAGLPDTYGHTAEELADLLNGWRGRYADTHPNNSFKGMPLRGTP